MGTLPVLRKLSIKQNASPSLSMNTRSLCTLSRCRPENIAAREESLTEHSVARLVVIRCVPPMFRSTMSLGYWYILSTFSLFSVHLCWSAFNSSY